MVPNTVAALRQEPKHLTNKKASRFLELKLLRYAERPCFQSPNKIHKIAQPYLTDTNSVVDCPKRQRQTRAL